MISEKFRIYHKYFDLYDSGPQNLLNTEIYLPPKTERRHDIILDIRPETRSTIPGKYEECTGPTLTLSHH